jgi:hypothetical protein
MLPLASLFWGWTVTIIVIAVSLVVIGLRYLRGEIKRR